MDPSSLHQSKLDIRLQSSLAEIGEKLHSRGIVSDPTEPIESVTFRTYVLDPHITRMEQVHQLLRQLDVDSKMKRQRSGCAKAQSAREWMAQGHGGAPDVTWAIIGLNLSRNKDCSCHETGSLHPARRNRRGIFGARPSFFRFLADYFSPRQG